MFTVDVSDSSHHKASKSFELIVFQPQPTITFLTPGSTPAGSPAFILTVDGHGFISTSTVKWNGSPLATQFVSTGRLTAYVSGSLVAKAGTASITVFTPGVGTSEAVPFPIPTTPPTPTPTPTPGIVSVISENNAGFPANGVPNDLIALSANGRYAAFQNANATNLVGPPTVSQAVDTYFHDSCVGVSGCSTVTKLASVINGLSDDGGNDGNAPSFGEFGTISISGDGNSVVFFSHASNLVSPAAKFKQAYIRQTCAGGRPSCTPSTKMVSLTDSGSEPNDNVTAASISASGRFVAFASFGTNLVQTITRPGQAYLHDTNPVCTPGSCTILVSADNNGNPDVTNGIPGVAVSANGRFVAFSSFSLSLPGNTNEHPQVFVRDTCLNAPANLNCQPSTTVVGVDNNNKPHATDADLQPSISDDGRVVAFTSTAQLAPNSLPDQPNVYLRDTCQTEAGPVANCTPSTVTVSVASDGSPANSFSGGSQQMVSGTGRFVVFTSNATNLVPGGTGDGGVFVRDTCIGAPSGCTPTTMLVSLDLSGNFVRGEAPVISSDGHFCAFMVSGPSGVLNFNQAVLARCGTFANVPSPDFSLSASPDSLTVAAGASGTSTVTLTSSGGFAGDVTLSSGALPQGVHVSFNPSIVHGAGTSVTTVTVDPSVPPTSQPVPIMVTGSSGSLSHSTTVQLSVTTPVPAIASINPTSAVAGGPGFTLQVAGQGFVGSSTVLWNGGQRSTTFVDGTHLTAQILASDIATPGTASVTVVNPAPGGGTSNAVTFTISPSSPPAGFVSYISASSDGTPAFGLPNPIIALSTSGRYAAFQNENDTHLVGPPTPSQGVDIYFHDSCVGAAPGCLTVTKLASVINGLSDDGGNDGNGPSIMHGAFDSVSISGDGRFVGFLSNATNLVSPSARFEQAYIRDTCTGAGSGCTRSTKMVSLNDSGAEADRGATDAAISASGRFVAFSGGNLFPNVTAGGVYLRDTNPGCAPGFCTILVSADNNTPPNPANDGGFHGVPSANGRFVAFDTTATNLPGAPTNHTKEVYVRDTCLNAPAILNCHPSTILVSVDDSRGAASPSGTSGLDGTPSISDDGRFIAFTSTDQLAPNSLLNNTNLYLRDTCQTEDGPVAPCTPHTLTAIVAFDGSAANDGATFGPSNPHTLSGTGRFVVFNSGATNLVQGGNPAGGVFVRDTCGQPNSPVANCTPATHLVSKDSQGNFFGGVSAVISSDGHFCAFMSSPGSAVVFVEEAVLCRTGF